MLMNIKNIQHSESIQTAVQIHLKINVNIT